MDHNEPKQRPGEFPPTKANNERIRGIIDHHAVSEGFITAAPVFVDIRGWGSACSIIAHNFVRMGKPISQSTAKLLLCGIISDTINLTSNTTTDADRLMCVLLTVLADVEAATEFEFKGEQLSIRGPNQLACAMFKAKTNWFVGLGAYEVCRGDMKRFTVKSSTKADGQPWRFAWATAEVTKAKSRCCEVSWRISFLCLGSSFLRRRSSSSSSGASAMNGAISLSIVDIVNGQTNLLICGGRELALAQAMFPECPLHSAIDGATSKDEVNWDSWASSFPSEFLSLDQTCMPLGVDKDGKPRVSRKLQFIPPVLNTLNDGFVLDKERAMAALHEATPQVTAVFYS